MCGWGGEDIYFMINIIEVWNYFFFDEISFLLENFKQNVNFLSILSIFNFFLMLVRKNDEIVNFREKSCFGTSKCQKTWHFWGGLTLLEGSFLTIFFLIFTHILRNMGTPLDLVVHKRSSFRLFAKKMFPVPLKSYS